jgi:hypothetical protein
MPKSRDQADVEAGGGSSIAVFVFFFFSSSPLALVLLGQENLLVNACVEFTELVPHRNEAQLSTLLRFSLMSRLLQLGRYISLGFLFFFSFFFSFQTHSLMIFYSILQQRQQSLA